MATQKAWYSGLSTVTGTKYVVNAPLTQANQPVFPSPDELSSTRNLASALANQTRQASTASAKMADMDANPLLRFFEAQEKTPDSTVFPPYKDLDAKSVVPGMEEVLKRGTAALEALEKELSEKVEKNGETALTYDEVALPLEALSDRVDRVWSTARHLKSLVETEELRTAIETVQPKVVDFGLKVGQS